jgi:S1-C subfamily serine protease
MSCFRSFAAVFLFTFGFAALTAVAPARAQTTAATAAAQPSISDVRKSLVRITTTSQEPDYKVPWNPGNINRGVGAGFIIAGPRIVTNAHVISNSRFVSVEREGDPKQYEAKVKFVGHDCDLAVLDVADPGFFKGLRPLDIGGIPQLESTVSVYGYPIGGQRMSVTRGVVSRIDFQSYSHSAVDSHLAIQIDAAINPGNSGGPVLQNGKVVGVAFQGYSGDVAQNTGYMIATPVIQHFLKDIADGKYDKYVDLAIMQFKLQNPAQRRALGLSDDNEDGILVGSVVPGGACDGVLKEGDVILALDGLPVASDGFIQMEGDRLEMAEVVERKFKDDPLKLHILRDKKEMDVVAKLKPAWPYLIQGNAYDVRPRFVLFGGLLFQPLSRDFLEVYGIDDLRVRYFYDSFVSRQIFLKHPEVIILSQVLPDPINAYVADYKNALIDEVNGKPIKRLEDLAAAFAEPADYYVIKCIGEGRPLVLERAQVESARTRIKTAYNVVSEQNLSVTPAAAGAAGEAARRKAPPVASANANPDEPANPARPLSN